MGYSADHVASVRQRILDEANRLFRLQGYHKTSVNQIMENAGLTHGGFYAHFKSKEALFTQAMGQDLNFSLIAESLCQGDDGAENLAGLQQAVAYYLGFANQDKVGSGCTMVTLCPEIARMGEGTKQCYQDSFVKLVNQFQQMLGSREAALACIVQCVGGLTLARAMNSDNLAQELLQAAYQQAQRIMVNSRER